MRPETTSEPPVETTDFGGLRIEWDARVPAPRPWTEEQARWAAELAGPAPPGPVLELSAGGGEIGLLAAWLCGRGLVQVERDGVAASYALRNAAAAGIDDADVRRHPAEEALAPEERFPIVLAGSGEEDLDAGLRHLSPAGHLVLQVDAQEQVDAVSRRLAAHRDEPDRSTDPEILQVRDLRPRGLLVHIAATQDRGAGGQVSETENLADAGEPISPSDATAGHPTEDVQEGEAGPDAVPRENRRENRT